MSTDYYAQVFAETEKITAANEDSQLDTLPWTHESFNARYTPNLSYLADEQLKLVAQSFYILSQSTTAETDEIIHCALLLATNIRLKGKPLLINIDKPLTDVEFAKLVENNKNWVTLAKVLHHKGALEVAFPATDKAISLDAENPAWYSVYAPLCALILFRMLSRGKSTINMAMKERAPSVLNNLLQLQLKLKFNPSEQFLDKARSEMNVGNVSTNAMIFPLIHALSGTMDSQSLALLNYGCGLHLRHSGLAIIKMTLVASRKLGLSVREFVRLTSNKTTVSTISQITKYMCIDVKYTTEIMYSRLIDQRYFQNLQPRTNIHYMCICAKIIEPNEKENLWKMESIRKYRQTTTEEWLEMARMICEYVRDTKMDKSYIHPALRDRVAQHTPSLTLMDLKSQVLKKP